MGNQSTDCDDIIPQFKSNQQQPSLNNNQSINQKGIQPKVDKGYFSSESDDQQVKGLKMNQLVQKQLQIEEERKQVIQSSSPSSTSSEDEKTNINKRQMQKKESSQSVNSQNNDHQLGALKSAQQEQQRDDTAGQQTATHLSQQNTSKPKQLQNDSDNGDQASAKKQTQVQRNNQQDFDQNQPKELSEQEQQKPEQESSVHSDYEEDDEEEEDEPTQSESSFIVEISPKGRFKRFGEELGRGAFKIVYKGVDNETGREIAWNVINLKRLPKSDKIRIKSEIDLIKKLEHQNIIHFISAWVNKQKEQVVFITEMITGGSLRSYVKKIKNPRLRVIKGWCIKIIQGLIYLHDQKPHPIIHRDLKCDNIFINSHSGEIRIGDLGLSTPMQNSYTTSVLGTPEFMAPELYEECYGTGVDIYAFGMCVLEMITLERPYKECQNPAQIYNKVIQGIRPQALDRIEDDEVKEFILWCLSSAEKRPTAKDLLESKFLKDLDNEKNNQSVKVRPPIKYNGPKRKKSFNYKMQREKSTILEEEEENSEDDVEERKLRLEIQQHQARMNEDNNNSDSQSKVNVNQQISDNKTQNADTMTTDQTQKQTDVNQSASTHIDENNQSNITMTQSTIIKSQDTNLLHTVIEEEKKESSKSSLEELQKKQRKKESKNKKLNESVIFLKQIDKEKQKKMQERTMRMEKKENQDNTNNSNSSNDDEEDVADPENRENMLAQLRQDIEQEQQLQQQLQKQQEHQQIYQTQKSQLQEQSPHKADTSRSQQQPQQVSSSQNITNSQKRQSENQIINANDNQSTQLPFEKQLIESVAQQPKLMSDHRLSVRSLTFKANLGMMSDNQVSQNEASENQPQREAYHQEDMNSTDQYQSEHRGDGVTEDNKDFNRNDEVQTKRKSEYQQANHVEHQQLTKYKTLGSRTTKHNDREQNRNSQQNLQNIERREKKEAVAIGKTKNFKEDTTIPQKTISTTQLKTQPNVKISQQIAPSVGQNQDQRKKIDQQSQEKNEKNTSNEQVRNKQSTAQASSDDLKRTNSRDTQEQLHGIHSSQVSIQNQKGYGHSQVLTEIQKQQQQMQQQYFHNQNSDSYLSGQGSKQTRPQELKQKANQISNAQQEHKTHFNDNVFDNRSLSDSDSSSAINDPDVESIQLPKNQSEMDQIQQSHHQVKSEQTTPFNDSNVQMVFHGRSSAEILYHQMKKPQNPHQNLPPSSSQNSINQSQSTQQQSQSSQGQKVQIQNQSVQQKIPTTHAHISQPIKAQQQLVQQQMTDQDTKPPAKSKASYQSIDQVKQSTQQTHPQQQNKAPPRKEESQQAQPQPQVPKNSIPSYSQPQKSNFPQVILSPDFAIRKEDKNKLNMSFKIKSLDGSPDKEVIFDFDINNDTALGVAEEMVKELQLPSNYVEIISKQIQNLIGKNFYQQQTQEVQKQQVKQIDQSQGQPNQKKDSPTKISKDSAITLFNKLFEGIDSFFQIMQSKNIEKTDEIIEAMEGSSEEMALKLEFLNNVYKAKHTYKKQMEEYRKRIELKKKQQQQQAAEAQAKQQQQIQLQQQLQQQQLQQQQQMQQKLSQDKVQQAQILQKSQNQQPQLQKKPTNPNEETLIKRVNSTQDMQINSQQHLEERKQQIISQPIKQTISVPAFVRKNFKVSPAQFTYPIKLSKVLRRTDNEAQDEEVLALQHIINLIMEVSVIQSMQSQSHPTEAPLMQLSQQFVMNYLPLRLDGHFAEKTELHIQKFQNHIKVNPDGIVTDQLWNVLISYAEHIVKEDSRKQLQLQQVQQVQQQKEQKPVQVNQSQVKQGQSLQPSKDKMVDLKSMPTSQQQIQKQGDYNHQKRQGSPSKYSMVNSKKHGESDWQSVIEQTFKGKHDYIQDGEESDNDQ